MVTWTNKHWGALIGAAVLLIIAWLGLGAAAKREQGMGKEERCKLFGLS
jgi:hypothetical protein